MAQSFDNNPDQISCLSGCFQTIWIIPRLAHGHESAQFTQFRPCRRKRRFDISGPSGPGITPEAFAGGVIASMWRASRSAAWSPPGANTAADYSLAPRPKDPDLIEARCHALVEWALAIGAKDMTGELPVQAVGGA
jgi:hypothetical protein